MVISFNWLKEYIDIQDSPQRICEILTDIGLEVGGLEQKESIKGGLEGLVVGEVKTKEKHPNADKLSCTTVDVGGKVLSIVCGAPNVAAGQKVVVATIGTTLYDGDDSFQIKKSKIRGELSEGMLCGANEIGVGADTGGILELPLDIASGTLAKDYFKVETDWIIEIDITPNRADALSHYGVARDLVAYYKSRGVNIEIQKPVLKSELKGEGLPVEIEVLNKEACPRYAGLTIKGVKVEESPEWLRNKLLSIGLNPINNVVDVTNFVLHELGQPLHAFDYAVTNGKVVVKTDCGGEKFITLDESEKELHEDDLMICNDKEGMCIAGVFGGAKSGVSENTTDIFLESAYFNPVFVRKTSKRHNLKTDASFRFERGVDPNNTVVALQRAVDLIIELAGGEIACDLIDLQYQEFNDFQVDFSYENCSRLLGETISEEKIKSIFDGLEIKVLSENNGVLKLSVPQYRVDVQRECDVIEDILRIYGYNEIEVPTKLNASIVNEEPITNEKVSNKISELLVSNGFNEILNNSLTKSSYTEGIEGYEESLNISLLNPLSNDLAILRRTMLFGGLETITRNQNMKNSDLKLFEFGKTYWKNEEGVYNETSHLSLFLSGRKQEEGWNSTSEKLNYFSLKGIVELLLNQVGVDNFKYKPLTSDLFKEGVALYVKKKLIAEFGQVKSALAKQLGVKQEVYYADIKLSSLLELAKNVKVKYKELPKFHPVKRDLSLLLDSSVSFKDVYQLALESERSLLKEVELFDVYEGDKLPKGKKSYALSFKLQSEEKTLSDKDIEKSMNKLINAYTSKLNAELR